MSNAIQLQQPQQGAIMSADSVTSIMTMARAVAASDLLQSSARDYDKRVADAFFVMSFGVELGIQPMNALTSIYAVNGKPTCSGKLMLTLMRSRGFGVQVPDPAQVLKDASATIKIKRPESEQWQSFTYTQEMAQKAGLWGKGTWAKYPAQMLIWRAVSTAAQMAASDAIMNMYLPDEIDNNLAVDEDGAVIGTINPVTAETPVQLPQPETSPPIADWVLVPGNLDNLLTRCRSSLNLTDEQIAEYAGISFVDDTAGWSKYASAVEAANAIKTAHGTAQAAQANAEAATAGETPEAVIVENVQEAANALFDEDAKEVHLSHFKNQPHDDVKLMASNAGGAPVFKYPKENLPEAYLGWIATHDHAAIASFVAGGLTPLVATVKDGEIVSIRASAPVEQPKGNTETIATWLFYSGRNHGTAFFNGEDAGLPIYSRELLRNLGDDYAEFAATFEKGNKYTFKDAGLKDIVVVTNPQGTVVELRKAGLPAQPSLMDVPEAPKGVHRDF